MRGRQVHCRGPVRPGPRSTTSLYLIYTSLPIDKNNKYSYLNAGVLQNAPSGNSPADRDRVLCLALHGAPIRRSKNITSGVSVEPLLVRGQG